MKFFNAALISALAASAYAQVQGGSAQIMYSCVVPNTIAFTIDDGPTEHTPELLAALADANIVATFYVNGANVLKDVNGDPLPSVVPFIKDIYDHGHEIGSHTYNHACLTQECHLNNPQIAYVMDTKEAFTEQIVKNEDLIYQAIGLYPATYRAPFGDGQNPGAVNNDLLQWLAELGYPYAIHWDIETRDMENSAQGEDFAFNEAKAQYESPVAQNDKLITLQHAIPVTINQIIPYIKNVWMPAHPNMKFVKVSECLGLTQDAVYRKTKAATSSVPVSSSPNTSSAPVTQQGSSNLENSGATLIKASLTFVVSTLLTIFYLF